MWDLFLEFPKDNLVTMKKCTGQMGTGIFEKLRGDCPLQTEVTIGDAAMERKSLKSTGW